MEKQRSNPAVEPASNGLPTVNRSAAPKGDGATGSKAQVFRRKIDCGSSTETSAERLVLRDPGKLLRNHRHPNR